MSKTVVGIFEYESDAQTAKNELLASGFGEAHVDLKTARYKTPPADEEVVEADPDLFERIGHFFSELFGSDDHEAERYAEAGKQGTIVTVHAGSSEEALAAARIMDEFGAMDVMNNKQHQQAGAQYEDPIINPPAGLGNAGQTPSSVDARGLHLRSRVIDRPLDPRYRLVAKNSPEGRAINPDVQDTTELHKTIAERDALINEIVDNDTLNRPS